MHPLSFRIGGGGGELKPINPFLAGSVFGFVPSLSSGDRGPKLAAFDSSAISDQASAVELEIDGRRIESAECRHINRRSPVRSRVVAVILFPL